MKKVLISILFFISLSSLHAIDVGDKAINFEAKNMNSEIVNLGSFKNKKAVWLVFWATWCPNCKAEIPALKDLYKKYNDKLEIIAINVGVSDSIELTKEYIKQYNLPYDIIYSNKIARDYNVMGTPTQVVIDINGNVVFKGVHIPEDLKEADILGLIKQ